MTKYITLCIVEVVTGVTGFLIIGLKFSWWGAAAVFLINWSLLCNAEIRQMRRDLLKPIYGKGDTM